MTFLFYVSYSQQLQLSHLVLAHEEVDFVPKSGKIVKINRVTSSYKTDTPTEKSDIS